MGGILIARGLPSGGTVAFIMNLPLNWREATAFSNIEAGCPRGDDREVMTAWLVRMTLVHGSWVADELPILRTGNVSQT